MLSIFTLIRLCALGSALTNFALGVWIYETTGSATLFAIDMVVWMLPNIALSPVVGVLVDRWDRRLVMLLSDTGAGLSSLFVAIMLVTGELEVWHVYLAGFFNSAFGSFQWPFWFLYIPLLILCSNLKQCKSLCPPG